MVRGNQAAAGAAGAESGGRQASTTSVGRAFAVVEAMATYRGPATLTQISRAAQLPVPTVHRLVNRLVDLGYISHSPGHRFRIGPKFIPLGEAAVSSSLDAIGPLLRDLSDTVGETVSLVTLEQDRVVCVAYAESTRAVRVIVDPAMRPLPHGTAAGKVMLAQLDDDDVRALLKRTGLPASTTRTVTSADAAIAGVREVRADGYAIDVNELEVGLNCIAVPVRGIRCHALAVLGPSSRVTPDDRSRFVSYLDDAAAQIASLLDSWVPTAEPQGDGAATIPTSGGRTSQHLKANGAVSRRAGPDHHEHVAKNTSKFTGRPAVVGRADRAEDDAPRGP